MVSASNVITYTDGYSTNCFGRSLICCSRARKIRCDSTRPVCNNCTRRNNECEYDAVPKRRGPDKRPGTRQRSCKKRHSESEAAGSQAKKKRRTSGDHEGSLISFDVKENVTANTKKSLPLSRLNPDDATGLQVPQRAQLDLETRQVAPEAIYPKVSFICLAGRNEHVVDRYLLSAIRMTIGNPFDAVQCTLSHWSPL